jgi:hypothetical protein
MVAMLLAGTELVGAWPDRLASVLERVSAYVLPETDTAVICAPLEPRFGYGSRR